MRSAKSLHARSGHEGEHERDEERNFVAREFHRRRPISVVAEGKSAGGSDPGIPGANSLARVLRAKAFRGILMAGKGTRFHLPAANRKLL